MTLPGGVEDVRSLIQQLGDALREVEASKSKSVCNVDWSVVEEHFQNLHLLLKKNFEELEAREQEYREKEIKTHALLSERKASVAVKEQDLVDRIQELKDAAVASIARARPTHESASVEVIAVQDIKESKVSSLIDGISSSEEPPRKAGASLEVVASDVKPRLELVNFCEQMDAKGLLKFITENKKHVSDFRQDLSIALERATEPGQLVLDSLEGFYPSAETTQRVHERNASQRGMHSSCILLMKAMADLLARNEPGAQHLLNLEIKRQAKAIADQWKPMVTVVTDATNVSTLEAHAFLQLLSTFRIATEFDEDELCKLVLLVAGGKQTPELCRALGLTHKMPGVIESLVETGKHLDAVHFIQAFQLTEKFPPVALLKTYLKDLRRNSQGKGEHSSGAPGVQGGALNQELVAIKAIIGCIERYKLEAEYPLDPLQKRLAQLEKPRSDKKRPADLGRNQHLKKQKPSGKYPRFHGSAPASGRQAPHFLVNREAYVGMPERYTQAAAIRYDYQVPNQSASSRQTPPALMNGAAYAGMQERYTRAAAFPYDYQIPSQPASSQQTPPALSDGQSYAGIPERYSQTTAIQYDQSAYGQQTYGQQTYGQQAMDQQTYYYPQDERVAPTSYSAPPLSYTASGTPSLPQPYRQY